jgi:hypothetical protein
MNFFIKLITLNIFIFFIFISFQLHCENNLFGIFSPNFHSVYTDEFDCENEKNIYYYKNMKHYFYDNIVAGFLHTLVSSKNFNNTFYIDIEKLFNTFDENTLEKIKNFIKEEKIYKNQMISLKMIEKISINNNVNNENGQSKKIEVDTLYDLINECINNKIFISRNEKKILSENKLKEDYYLMLQSGEQNSKNPIFICQLKKELDFLKKKTKYDNNSLIHEKASFCNDSKTNLEKIFSIWSFLKYLLFQHWKDLIHNNNMYNLLFDVKII